MKTVYLFVFIVCAAIAVDLAVTQNTHAQDAASAAAAVQAQAAQPAASVAVLVASPATASVAVPEPAAPPEWASALIVAAQKLPIIGPIVSKILLYAGILSSILTALFATFFTVLSALSKVLNLAGLQKIAVAVEAFKKGKVMYWLSYLSMFNAKKPEAKPVA